MTERESQLDRITRLIAERIEAGKFKSESEVIELAEMSSGWLSEKRSKASEGKTPGINGATARRLAAVLDISVSELLGEEPAPPDDDEDPERSWAVCAARMLQYSEAAIRLVQTEPPGQSRLYWFMRIEAEAARLRPASRR